MQVEHINENTIRVRIEKTELAKRGLKVLDLLGDKNKIQHFFYSILDEIDTDHSFSQDAPVTFQVMPNNGGLDLLITKVTGKERNNLSQFFDGELRDLKQENEQDPRRSFFDLESDDENDDSFEGYEEKSSEAKAKKPFWKFLKKQAYCFSDIDDITELAESLRVNDISSSLYFERDEFFLDLSFTNGDYSELKPADAWAIANEYGIKVKQSEMARVRTTGKCLIKQDALNQVRHYFGQS